MPAKTFYSPVANHSTVDSSLRNVATRLLAYTETSFNPSAIQAQEVSLELSS